MEATQEEVESTKSYILGLCSAIGGLEEIKLPDGSVGQVYCPGDEALACLKDLKKAVRIDSQNNEKTVLNALVEYNLVETDLVPLILSFQKERNEVAFRFILACVELLVPMTWPTDKSLDDEDEEQAKEDPNLMNIYRKYKLDLLRPGVFETILALIMKSVRIPERDRSIIDQSTIRLALYLFRNLTAIPDLNTSQSASMEQLKLSRLQETLLIRYYEADVIEFLLTIASNSDKNQANGSEWNMLVLESIYNIVNRVNPKDIILYRISDGLERADLSHLSSKLSSLLTEESRKKKQKTQYTPSRHNRFGGTYTLDWDGKKRVSHKQVAGFADPSLIIEGDKGVNRVGLKRKLEDTSSTRDIYQNGKSIMYLKLTAQSFIQSCFNVFYTSIMKDMQREDFKIVKQDYSRYFYTMKWFLEYHGYEEEATAKRKSSTLYIPTMTDDVDHDNKDFTFGYVAAALDLKAILFCLRHVRAKLDSKEWFDVQMATDCFGQMLVSVGIMARSNEEEYKNVAEHIQSNLFYEQSHLDLLVEVLKSYSRQSFGYLRSAIRVTHVLLKSLDAYLLGKKMVFVRRVPKPKAKKKASATEEEEPLITDNVEESEDEETVRDRQAEYKEHAFHIDNFEKKYASVDVIRVYCTLLEEYMDLKPIDMDCITFMFHRLLVKKKQYFLFWKIHVLELFNRILQDSHRLPKTAASKGLVKFITYSTYQFFKAAKQYPLLFVEALIPNMKSDRSMWEIPNEADIREKERYLADVNYIPPSSTTRADNTDGTPASREQTPEADDNNIMDDDTMDYLFSAFDRRNGQEDDEANKENINREEEVEASPTLPPLKPTTTTSRSLDTEDYDDIGEYQSYFGENKENENNTTTSSVSKENDFPSGSYGDEDSSLTLETAEVDKLLFDMGVGSKV